MTEWHSVPFTLCIHCGGSYESSWFVSKCCRFKVKSQAELSTKLKVEAENNLCSWQCILGVTIGKNLTIAVVLQ